MTQSVPATTTQAPIDAAPEGKTGAPEKPSKPAKATASSTAKLGKDEWLAGAIDEIGETSEPSDEDEPESISAKPKAKDAKGSKEAPVRGEDGKFLPKDEAEKKPSDKVEKKPEAKDPKEDDKPKDEVEKPAAAKELEKNKKALDEEIASFSSAVREERTKQQTAWTNIHREAAKIRLREETLKQKTADLERLQKLETRLKSDGGDKYKAFEELGGKLGDWQTRAVAGEGPSPQLEDFKKFVEDRDAQWQKQLDEVRKVQLKRDEDERAAAVDHRVRSAESTFDNKLFEESSKYEHTKAMGPAAVDRAHDFAEYVARALQGRRDIPRSEVPWVNDYLKNVPESVALDPGQIVAHVSKRIAREASMWGMSPKQSETPQASTIEEPKTETRTSRGSQVLDNAAAGTRATPKSPLEMSRSEWDKYAADHIHELDPDEVEDPKHRR
jgi:hypothetical protein